MKLAARLIALLVILALGFWLWGVFFPSPERAIRLHLERTARAASFKANEGPLDQLRNIGELSQCFSPDAEVKFESPGGGSQSFSGRDELMRAAGAARTSAAALRVDFLDASVVVAPDGDTATVDLTVRAAVPGDRDFFVQEMKLYLKKFGRSWLIIRAETVKTLSRVGCRNERAVGFCNPNGIVSHSPRLREPSYLAWLPTRISTPTGLRHDSPRRAATPLGLRFVLALVPRVACASQPLGFKPESRWDSSSSHYVISTL